MNSPRLNRRFLDPHRLANFLTGHRHLLLVLSLLAMVLLAIGIPRSGFDTSISVLMTRSDPYLQERDRMIEEFPARQEISFAFVPANGDVFTLPTLQALADLSREFRQIPLAVSISSILEWQSPYGTEILFERPLAQIASYTTAELSGLRERALNDQFAVGSLISPSADLALVSIRLSVTTLDSEQSRATAQASMALRDSLQARHPEVGIHVNSEALYEQSNRSAMISDLTLLLPLVLLVCNAIICYSFRSILLGLSILVVALVTVVMTVGTLGWGGQSFNTISVMAPLVVVTIAVADSVHLVSIFRQNLQGGMDQGGINQGGISQGGISQGDMGQGAMNRNLAMAGSLAFNIRPISLATLTTVIGFASLNLASSPAISAFGSVVAIGVLFAYVLTLTMLPALVLLLPQSSIASFPQAGRLTLTRRITNLCQGLVMRRGSAVLLATALLAAVALPLSFLNRTDFDRMSFITEDSPLHGYYEAVSERMSRGPQLLYGVDARQEFGGIEPEFLQGLDRFSAWLREQEEVIDVASLVELVKTVNQVTNENRPEAYQLPDTVAEVEEHLFNYQLVQERDYALDTLASADFSLLRLFVTTRPLSNQQLIDLNVRINAEFARQLPAAALLHGSSTLLFARMDEAVTIELLEGYGLTLLLITVTLIVGMRSVYHGLLSLLPNLLPAVLVFGVWGLLVGQIDPFVMMLFSISVGLVVDDTVHVLSTYQNSRAQGATSREAVERALLKAGPALIITTTVLAMGTLVLIAASTLYFQQAASLLVPIVVVALVLDLTFFPALLMQFDRRR